MIMFMNSITDLINKRAMLVSIPRIATVLFILLQLIGMQTYPGGTIHDMSLRGILLQTTFFLIWVPMLRVMVSQIIYP